MCFLVVVINTTYPAGHIVLSLLVLMAFNVGFGCIAGILTMIEVCVILNILSYLYTVYVIQ